MLMLNPPNRSLRRSFGQMDIEDPAVDSTLEQLADELLKDSTLDEHGILSERQLRRRRSRELYTATGFVDSGLFESGGMFNRSRPSGFTTRTSNE